MIRDTVLIIELLVKAIDITEEQLSKIVEAVTDDLRNISVH